MITSIRILCFGEPHTVPVTADTTAVFAASVSQLCTLSPFSSPLKHGLGGDEWEKLGPGRTLPWPDIYTKTWFAQSKNGEPWAIAVTSKERDLLPSLMVWILSSGPHVIERESQLQQIVLLPPLVLWYEHECTQKHTHVCMHTHMHKCSRKVYKK